MISYDYYLFSYAPLMIFSIILRVCSRLFYMGSLRVWMRFLQRLVLSKIRIWLSFELLGSYLRSMSKPDLRILRSWSVKQLMGRCRLWSRVAKASLSIQNNNETKLI
jgi:hypothetical protein